MEVYRYVEPVPQHGLVMKLVSNTPMYTRMVSDMDINCGVVIDGEATIPELGQRIFEQLLRHASGEPTKLGAKFVASILY